MVHRDELDALWEGAEPFHVETMYDPVLPVAPELCAWASELSEFCEQLIATLDETSPPVKFRQAKYLLSERYMEFRAKAPRNHRDNLGSKKHVCLYHVFIQVYEYITKVQLTAIPPQIEVKHVPAPPPVPVVRQPTMSTIFGIDDDWYPFEDTKEDAPKDTE